MPSMLRTEYMHIYIYNVYSTFRFGPIAKRRIEVRKEMCQFDEGTHTRTYTWIEWKRTGERESYPGWLVGWLTGSFYVAQCLNERR